MLEPGLSLPLSCLAFLEDRPDIAFYMVKLEDHIEVGGTDVVKVEMQPPLLG